MSCYRCHVVLASVCYLDLDPAGQDSYELGLSLVNSSPYLSQANTRTIIPHSLRWG